MIQSDQ